MKVLWLCPYPLDDLKEYLNYQPNLHIGTWLKYLVEEIGKNNNIEVEIISFTRYADRDYMIKKGNLTFHILTYTGVVKYTIMRKFLSIVERNLFHNYYFLEKKAIKLINKLQPQLLDVHGTENNYGIIANKLNIPTLIHIQGVVNIYYKDYNSNYYKNLKKNERTVFQKQKYFITVPGNMEDEIVAQNPNAKFFRLFYPIAPYCFELYEKVILPEIDIIFVGRLNKLKGVYDIINAIKLVKRKIPNISVKIVGNGTKKTQEELKRFILTAGLQENVFVLGPIDQHSDILDLVKRAKIFLLPTYKDSGPRSVAESMAIGTPVISYSVDGLPKMIENEKEGILLEPGNIKKLADTIIELLLDKKKRDYFGKNAHKRALKDYNSTSIVDMTLKIYKEILKV